MGHLNQKYFGIEIFLALLALTGGIRTYQRIDLGALSFRTGLYASIAASCSILLITLLLFRFLKTKKKRRLNILTSTFTTFLLLFLLEITLRGIGMNATYGEMNGNPHYFLSADYENRDTWYFTSDPYQEICYLKSEFVFERTANSLGIHEKEIPFEKGQSEFRILALGDSFTEGVMWSTRQYCSGISLSLTNLTLSSYQLMIPTIMT